MMTHLGVSGEDRDEVLLGELPSLKGLRAAAVGDSAAGAELDVGRLSVHGQRNEASHIGVRVWQHCR